MLKNKTTVQRRGGDFHKSEALAQTNQIKYDCFSLQGTENKKTYSQDLKLETKIPGMFFLDFILLFNIAVEKFGRKIIWPSWSSRKRFF